MPDTPSLTLVKRFTYRDAPEEWSNTYHFSGPTPADAAAWKALALAFFAQERKLYTDGHVLVTTYGYEAGNEHSVAQIDHTVDPEVDRRGTLAIEGDNKRMAGDQAGWFRAYIRQSATGKKVYVRKYIHGGTTDAADPDECSAVFKLRLQQVADAMRDGTGLDGRKWCGPQGETAGATAISRYCTTRTLKRRGKRPS